MDSLFIRIIKRRNAQECKPGRQENDNKPSSVCMNGKSKVTQVGCKFEPFFTMPIQECTTYSKVSMQIVALDSKRWRDQLVFVWLVATTQQLQQRFILRWLLNSNRERDKTANMRMHHTAGKLRRRHRREELGMTMSRASRKQDCPGWGLSLTNYCVGWCS